MRSKLLFEAIAVWCGFAVAAILNGVFREAVLTRHVGKRRIGVETIRLLARIMFWAGWVSLGLGILLTVASLLTPSPMMMGYDQMAPGTMLSQPWLMTVGSSIYGAFFSLALFFGWGALTILCRISDQLEEQNQLMQAE